MNKIKIISLYLFLLILLAGCASAAATPIPPTPTPSPAEVIANAARQGDVATVAITLITWGAALKISSAILAAAIVLWLGTKVTSRSNNPAVLIMVLFIAIVAAAIVSKIFWLWPVALLVAAMYVAYLFFSNKYTLRRVQMGGRSHSDSGYMDFGSDEFALTPNPESAQLTTSAELAKNIRYIFHPEDDDENT